MVHTGKGTKIIFLDCDGVINSIQWEAVRRDMPPESIVDDAIDPRCLKRIVDVCAATGAKIVISSDWRVNWPFARTRLEHAGIPEGLIIDRTPVFNIVPGMHHFSRGEEIQAWLDDHDDIYDYIIIDDREDFLPDQIRLHLVHIDNWVGFTEKYKKSAIEMLSASLI